MGWKTFYESIEEMLVKDPDAYLIHYNPQRPHKGRIPVAASVRRILYLYRQSTFTDKRHHDKR